MFFSYASSDHIDTINHHSCHPRSYDGSFGFCMCVVYVCANGCASMSYEGVSVETRRQYQVSFSITLLLLSLDSLSPSLQGEVRVSGEESVS